MTVPEGVEVCSDTRDVSLMQEEDCAGRAGVSHQFLRMFQEDAGGGNYLVLETERWAIDADAIDEFATMLKHFMQGK